MKNKTVWWRDSKFTTHFLFFQILDQRLWLYSTTLLQPANVATLVSRIQSFQLSSSGTTSALLVSCYLKFSLCVFQEAMLVWFLSDTPSPKPYSRIHACRLKEIIPWWEETSSYWQENPFANLHRNLCSFHSGLSFICTVQGWKKKEGKQGRLSASKPRASANRFCIVWIERSILWGY